MNYANKGTIIEEKLLIFVEIYVLKIRWSYAMINIINKGNI